MFRNVKGGILQHITSSKLRLIFQTVDAFIQGILQRTTDKVIFPLSETAKTKLRLHLLRTHMSNSICSSELLVSDKT